MPMLPMVIWLNDVDFAAHADEPKWMWCRVNTAAVGEV